jgi:hypothetical protein
MSDYTVERAAIYATDSATVGCKDIIGGYILGGSVGGHQIGDTRNYFGNTYKMESGMRFRKLTIPADAIITVAKLKLIASWNQIDSVVNAKIHIQDGITAKPFIASNDSYVTYLDYISRPRLAAEIEWDITEWVPGIVYESPDFSSIIQDLIDANNGLSLAGIVVFWGDLEGLTPAPPAQKANALGWSTSLLHLEFSSAMGIPTRPARNIFSVGETDMQDFSYGLDDIEIRNDVRYLIPHHHYELDRTQTPPVNVPVDFIHVETDGLSDQKYGRRTQIIKWRIPSDWGGIATCKANLEKKKEPLIQAQAKIAGKDDDNIEKCLKARLSDICQVYVDSLVGDFWVDGITLSAGKIPEMILALSEKSLKETLNIFTLDEDVLDGEAVLA